MRDSFLGRKLRGLARRLLRRRPAPIDVNTPAAVLALSREGVAPLAGGPPPEGSLHVATVVPSFNRGSGGHSTIMHLLRGLEDRGHRCSVWIEGAGDPDDFGEWFGAPGGGVRSGFEEWHGADVVLATGWSTVFGVMRLSGAGARAYLAQDHEPEFFGASAERLWAERTYSFGLPCIAASPWLAGLLEARYGATAHPFDLGVDHHVYHPRSDVTRRHDLVLFYARATTPRRGVPLGLLALEELHRRRPHLDIALFGEGRPIVTHFPSRGAGVLDGPGLARLYSEAAAGLVLSLSNPSLVPTEMMACGLPVVDVAVDSMSSTFGDEGAVLLAEPDPLALADALERALDDSGERAAAGLELARSRTWAHAAEQVEAALRAVTGSPA